MRPMRRMLFAVCLLTGCPSEPPPACKTVDTACAPGYTPTFENVYANTIVPSCGTQNSACHSERGAAGNLSLHDEQTALQQLQMRLTPGDASCSELVVRVDSPGEDYQMPPGDPLSPEERCAVLQWVQQGAMP